VCRSIGKRIKSALCWMVTTAIVCALVLGILYGMYICLHDALVDFVLFSLILLVYFFDLLCFCMR
jgi:ABC-type dipeptide/oligopeptide/nickel transport system permease subunit